MNQVGEFQSGPPWAALITVMGAMLLTASGPQAALGQSQATPQRTGEELYRAACSSCHGENGKGAPQSQLGFDIPLPDFADCSFASREPDADWLAVAHDGGPTRSFSKMMPAFGEALTIAELERVLSYIRLMCQNPAWPRGELNLPRPLVTEKAYPEDEAVLTTVVSAQGSGSVHNEIVYEKRFGARNQLEVVIPFGWRESGGSEWAAGVGDVAVGLKRVLFHSLEKGAIFSLVTEVALPSGDEEKGFGKGTVVFEPFAAYGQILPGEFFLHAQGGLELPTDTGKAEREAFWRVALGRSFSQARWGRSWSPMLEILGAKQLVSTGKTQWDLLPQLQVTLNRRQHVMLNLGVRLPVTERGSRDTQILIYLLWDWFDGGFLEGW